MLWCIVIAIFCLFPVYWAIVSSLRPGSDVFSTDIIPKNISLDNYTNVFNEGSFLPAIYNSMLVATITVAISVCVSFLAAYVLSREDFKYKKHILASILSVKLFPQIAVLSGMLELIRFAGLYNNITSLIFSYMIFTVPVSTLLLVTFIKSIPKEIEEAAIMDGASVWKIVFTIIFPIIKPAIAATCLLSFVAAWNEFLFALTFTLTDKARTIPIAISLFGGASQYELPWGNIMAASVIVTIPLLVLAIFFQKRIISGLTSGAVKG